jgi:hypothetical protein
MAGRDPWTMRNGGILGGLFPDDGQDLAFRDLAPFGEPAWAQATRDLMAKSAQGSSAARDYPIPGQPAPWFPSAPSATNTWPAPPQLTTAAYFDSQARGPSWLGDSSGNPPPLLHKLPYFASDLNSSSPVADSRNLAGSPLRYVTTDTSRPAPPDALVPAAYDESVRPWWKPAPLPDVFEPWRQGAMDGWRGLFNYFQSRRSSGGGGGDQDCVDRWMAEYDRCSQFYPFGVRYGKACEARANDRLTLCVGNGGKPRPDEPKEYGWNDIPRDSPTR